VYNSLNRSDQKELLRHMVERVIIDATGTIRLELRAPFAYLRDISKQAREKAESSNPRVNAKTGTIAAGLNSGRCSDSFQLCGEDKSLSEPSASSNASDFLQQIAFPQRASIARFTNPEQILAFR
jgi:hypothetical protein